MFEILNAYRYPRLTILALLFLFSYFILSADTLPFKDLILSLGIIGGLFAGFFYVFSFTAPAATAVLLILGTDNNILVIGLVAGLGALIGDLIIFKTARKAFGNEFIRLRQEPIIRKPLELIEHRIRRIIKITIALIFIASPLPDEIGVTLIANTHALKQKYFIIWSYLLNTAGIFVLLWLGKSIA